MLQGPPVGRLPLARLQALVPQVLRPVLALVRRVPLLVVRLRVLLLLRPLLSPLVLWTTHSLRVCPNSGRGVLRPR